MERLFQDFISPYWWISVVVVGVILNVIATYLKDYIDKKRAKWSESYRAKSEKKRLEEEQEIEETANSEILRTIKIIKEFRLGADVLQLSVWAFFCFTIVLLILNTTELSNLDFMMIIIMLSGGSLFIIFHFKEYEKLKKDRLILDKALEKIWEDQKEQKQKKQPVVETEEI